MPAPYILKPRRSGRRRPPETKIMNDILKKRNKICLVKDLDPNKPIMRAYISTYQIDRDGDRFMKGGLKTENYKKNPVVLWAHNPMNLPIAKTVDLAEDDIGYLATGEFDEEGQLSSQVLSLMRRGFLNATSIGFMPTKYAIENRDGGAKGYVFMEAELLEWSVVNIPSNPGALAQKETALIALKTPGLENLIEVVVTKGMGEQYLILPAPQVREAAPTAKELEPALEGIIELARVAKGTKLDSQRRALVTTAVGVMNELLADDRAPMSREDLLAIASSLKDFAGVVANVYPTAADAVRRTISQIDKAVTGAAA